MAPSSFRLVRLCWVGRSPTVPVVPVPTRVQGQQLQVTCPNCGKALLDSRCAEWDGSRAPNVGTWGYALLVMAPPMPTQANSFRDSRYRVFVSHKKSDGAGCDTPDSRIAKDVWSTLQARGVPCFLAEQEVPRAGDSEYIRVIDSALQSAELLVVVATAPQHLEGKWVRYEWESFANDVLSGRKKDGRIYSYIDGFSIDELPRMLRQHQVFKHGEGQIDRLFEAVAVALGVSTIASVAEQGTRSVDQFKAMTQLIAQCHLLEMEFFSNSPLGQFAMSSEQSKRMRELMSRLQEFANPLDPDARGGGPSTSGR